ncbi:MAG: hypothetical protein HY400_07195, partial [Elusimicrobia bacterium]|nr:hypothetical protein [Elusimicrobiota bacterium]
AGTRIKTVEYNFGGYYNGTDLASASAFPFPTRTVKLPESGKIIRSAWLEYEGLAVSNNDVNPITIRFDAGTSASTARFTSVQYTDRTGESIRLFVRADVTSVLTAQLANLAAGQTFTAAVIMTGPSSNMHTMKLFITYEYDDTSPVQVKTVRFALYSDFNNLVAAFTAQQAAGTLPMTYNVEVVDSGASIQQQWFEIRGFRQARSGQSGTDGTILCRVGNNPNEPTMTLDNSLIDSYDFRYISSSTIVAGFSLNAQQTLNIVTANDNINTLGGEVVVTYEYANNSAQKTKTVKYFVGQSTGVVNGIFSVPLSLQETGIILKRVYARITGSYDSATAANTTIDSSIGGAAVAQRNYSLQSNALQISGFQFFHDMTSAVGGWSNGAVLRSTVAVTSSQGATGMELIVTYQYTDEAAYTGYSVWLASQSVSGITKPYAAPFTVYFPETSGARTLRGAYIAGETINNTTTQDFTTTLDINGVSAQTVQHRTTIEATHVARFYEDSGQIDASGTVQTSTANYTISSAGGAFGGTAHIVYTYLSPPNAPNSLDQYKLNGITPISVGNWTNQSTIQSSGTLSSPMSSDSLALEVEVKPLGTSFDGAGLSTSSFISYSGAAVSTQVVVGGLSPNTQYHWRARVIGNGGSGVWSSFGGNPESSSDFGVDLTSPTAPPMASIAPVDGANLNTSTTTLDWEDVADVGGSGIENYDVEVATSTDFSTISASSSPSISQAGITGLSQNLYYWHVRSRDNAGNFGVYSSTRSFRVDLTSPTVGDNQSGDDTWRSVDPGAVYNVGFADGGGSLLNQIQYKVHSAPSQGGTLLIDWTDITAPPVNAASYTTEWGIAPFTSLIEVGTNYVSVRALDNAGNVSTGTVDAFYVRKDTTSPSTPSLSSPSDQALFNSGSQSFSWGIASDLRSGVQNYEIYVSTDQSFTVFTASQSLTGTTVGFSG